METILEMIGCLFVWLNRRGDGYRVCGGKCIREGWLWAVIVFAMCGVQVASGYTKLGPDRILLMNNDTKSACPMTYQGYYDTNKTEETYWVHHDNYTSYGFLSYLLPGINHTLYKKDGTALWHLAGCRAGSGTVVGSNNRNYIPWTTTSKSILSPYGANPAYKSATSAQAKGIGSVIMRNTTAATIYSPYYADGIGTIYFDTVNAFVNNLVGAIGVQIATNSTDGSALSSTNYSQFAWHDVAMDVLVVSNMTVATLLDTNVTTLVLNSTMGQYKYFFRVRTPVQKQLGGYYGPIRFRIIRKVAVGVVETAGLILVDDIEVSPPPTSAAFYQCGQYDSTRKGYDVLGFQGALSEPLLDATVTNALPRAYFEPITNASQGASLSDFNVTNVMFTYRWTYLNQVTSDWRQVELERDGDSLRLLPKAGTKPIDFSQGIGDIEYYITGGAEVSGYSANAYAFTPSDFASLFSKGYGSGWKETSLDLSARANTRFKETGGSDYFVRIRAGHSEWESFGFVAELELADGTKTIVTNSMELVSDNLWRTYYDMPTNVAGGVVRYGFCGKNRWEFGVDATAPCETNRLYLSTTDEARNIPFAGAANGSNWGTLELDDQATHLMIEFNDDTLMYGVSHANYQNFNQWADATKGFVGNATTTTGVSSVKTAYPANLNSWSISSEAANWWNESFSLVTYGGTDYPYYEPFATHRTPNGWTADQGTFVPEKRRTYITYGDTNGLALKMAGQGAGTVYMAGLTEDNIPNGVGTVSFDARAAQDQTFDSFAYDFNYLSQSKYAVSAQIMMSTLYNGTNISANTPSISLVVNYKPTKGCYEFRITRIAEYTLSLEIYKWRYKGAKIVSELLASKKGGRSNYDSNCYFYYPLTYPSTGTYNLNAYWMGATLSAYPNSDGTVTLQAKLSNEPNTKSINEDYGQTTGSNNGYRNTKIVVDATDDGSTYGSVFKSGTFGVGSCDCQAVFGEIMYHPMTAATTIDWGTVSTTLKNTIKAELDTDDAWALMPGRMEILSTEIASSRWGYGVQACVPETTVDVYLRTYGASDWYKVAEAPVTGFGNQHCLVEPHVTSNSFVQLRSGGTEDDVDTAVIVDNIEVTAWRGADEPTRTSSNKGLPNDWVSTGCWIEGSVVDGGTNRFCTIQPGRGSTDYPMGLRSPIINNGLSYVTIEFTNATRTATLLVQVATNGVTESKLNTITDAAPDSDYWATVGKLEFTGNDVYYDGGSGTKSCFFSLRSPISGVVRVVADPETITKAKDEGIEYGKVTITAIKCHDEPPLDLRCWWGWNMWVTGWKDGFPDARGFINDSWDGLSLALNWSPRLADNKTGVVSNWTGAASSPDLAEPEKAPEYGDNQYAIHDPFIQSPVIGAGIGQVSFRARKFDVDQKLPSIVSLYVSTNPAADEWSSAPITNFTVDSSTYQLYSWQTMDESKKYTSMRLMVTNAVEDTSSRTSWLNPIQRVMIDEIAVGESVLPKLSFFHVRPFRSGLGDTEEDGDDEWPTVITNITDMTQQPLIAESWGVQAEVVPEQMGDDLDQDSIRVYFAYATYDAKKKNWGLANWTNDADKVELVRCGTNLVWRSSYLKPSTVVGPTDEGGTIVQYCLWAEYKDRTWKAGDPLHEHVISTKDWTMPTWYRFATGKEPNEQYGAWSPYTVLDSISPERAWFNEVNYFDRYESNGYMMKTNQYVEIAAPMGADLTGWTINFYGGTKLVKGTLAVLGYNDCANATKKMVPCNNKYAFVTVQSPQTKNAGTLGSNADGTWYNLTDTANLFVSSGYLDGGRPFAFELVRKSGLIEHQIVLEGTNIYARYASTAYMGSGTNLCGKLLGQDESSAWKYVGADNGLTSVGVLKSHGEYGEYPNDPALNCWTNRMAQTPGRVNENQVIDPNWYVEPTGTNMWVYALVTGQHIWQVAGGETNRSALLVVPYGSKTNITYLIDAWYAIGSLTVEEDLGPTRVAAEAAGREGTYSYTLENVTNTTTITVVEDVALNKTMQEGDEWKYVSADNPYRAAVLDWLTREYPGYTTDDLKPVWFVGMSGTTSNKMDLTDIYWLDINPVQGDWIFKAGMGGVSVGCSPQTGATINDPVVEQIYYTNKVGGVENVISNVRVSVFMMITNTAGQVHTVPGKGDCNAYAPYCLRGLQPQSSSADYGASSPAWTSVTFRVTGALQNGKVNNVYQPLRWFVFGPDSFGDPDAPNAFTARIEVTDPFSTGAPTYSKGWAPYRGTLICYGWTLGGGLEYNSVEMLNSNSVYRVDK